MLNRGSLKEEAQISDDMRSFNGGMAFAEGLRRGRLTDHKIGDNHKTPIISSCTWSEPKIGTRCSGRMVPW